MKSTAKPKERDVMRLVQDWLSVNRLFFVRMNTYSGRVQSGAWMRQGVKGMADILVMESLLEGKDYLGQRVTWLELKAPKGKQTMEQIVFQSGVAVRGHRYFVIRSLEDLEKAFA